MKIVKWPNEILARPAKPVPQDTRCREIVEAMFEAMDFPNGIGIAAPQVGLDMQIICINVPAIRKGRMVNGSTKFHLINPELIWWKGGPVIGAEGCLSFPGERVLVPRPQRVKFRGFDMRWNPVTIGGKDLVARVLMHEFDHLRGVTLDHYKKLAEAANESAEPVEP